MIQYQQLMLTRGFQSSTEPRLHFGLDTLSVVDSLLVVWPDLSMQLLQNIHSGQFITVEQKNARGLFTDSLFFPRPKPLLVNVTDSIALNWLHRENDFFDFTRQYFIPHQLSTAGPKLAVGDVNKDGLDDLYVCGAKGQGGCLFLQTANRRFIASDSALFAGGGADETDALFFDANGDGYLDLYVVRGGNELSGNQPALQDHLYLNNGKGHFVLSVDALPAGYANKSTVCAADVDGDGDQDLFVGVRADARAYGQPCTSYLLLNNGKGHFTRAGEVNHPFTAIGLVTAASFTDLDKDGWPDLVVTGEWMPVQIYMNHRGKLIRSDQSLPTGLWQSLCVTDLDGDGYPDILAGNYGLNSKLHASPTAPLKLYVKDFNGDNTLAQLLTYTVNGREYPFLGKDELERKLPWIKKDFLSYSSFAGKTVQEIFGGHLQDALVLRAETLASCWLKNDGRGHFSVRPLPDPAQVSPVFAFLADDLDHDGKKDILTGGNFYGVLPYEGRYDANWGNILLDGSGTCRYISPASSGFLVRGEVRDLQKIRTADGYLYVVARNNDKLLFFRPAAQ
jgi:hypothetical protein